MIQHTHIRLAISLITVCITAPLIGQAFTDDSEVVPESSTKAVAYVYIQTTNGVMAYDANSAGKVTVIKGSPFATAGQMEASNGKYLISVGDVDLHTYPVESNGAIGHQSSVINTQDFGGAECGTTTTTAGPNGALLDHTGKYFYVQLYNPGSEANCAAWQSYKVASNGDLSFLGDAEYFQYDNDSNAQASTVPAISSNNKFAYGVFPEGESDDTWNTGYSSFAIAPDGVLSGSQTFTEKDPEANPNGSLFFEPSSTVSSTQADPSNHLAVLMFQEGFDYQGPNQLASYTINKETGAITSTNTWKNMPTVEINNNASGNNILSMSPSGKLLAVAGTGLQLYHFNGAAPITSFGSVQLPAVSIDQLAWDDNNHLYVLSYSAGELYVYTVTPTSAAKAAGSPLSVKDAYGINGLVVVPK
jgi:hypothetical protein